MLAAEVLIAHHNELRALLHRLAETSADQGEQRRHLLAELVAELTMHEQLEDDIYYPAVIDLSASVSIAHAEHRVIDDQLAAVLRADPTSPGFHVELGALIAAVEHHAGNEERDMFPEAAAKLDATTQRQLGAALASRLQELRSSRRERIRSHVKTAVLRRL